MAVRTLLTTVRIGEKGVRTTLFVHSLFNIANHYHCANATMAEYTTDLILKEGLEAIGYTEGKHKFIVDH